MLTINFVCFQLSLIKIVVPFFYFLVKYIVEAFRGIYCVYTTSVHISVLFVTGILERCSKQQFVNSLEIWIMDETILYKHILLVQVHGKKNCEQFNFNCWHVISHNSKSYPISSSLCC